MRSILIATAAVLSLSVLGLSACDAGRDQEDVMTPSGAPAPLAGPDTIPPTPAGDFQTGQAVIAALYALPSIPTDPAAVRRFFPEEFVPGLTPPAGEVGMISFDYRTSSQDGAADHLRIEEMAGGPTGSLLISHFTNLGVAKDITWVVCRQPAGALRIVDARFPGAGDQGPWTLRDLLDLPKRGDAC